MHSDAILEARGLVKRFGGFAAVAGIDLRVETGEIRCIIGPNGAGKSTFFRLVAGDYRAGAGTIHFNGQDISSIRSHKRVAGGIGIKFQVPSIFPRLSVGENLAVALQRWVPSRELTTEIDRVLGTLGLEKQREKLAFQLSHGQQQWLEIGMALSGRPTLILLDEPTAGMSPEETYRTGELVKHLNAQGMTVAAIEHDMAFVRQIAHKVTVLHCGKVFCEGSIEEIENNEDVIRIYLGNA